MAVKVTTIKLCLMIISMPTLEKKVCSFIIKKLLLKNLSKESNLLTIRIHTILESGPNRPVKTMR